MKGERALGSRQEVAGKNSLLPKECFKASSIRIVRAARFQRQG